MSTIINHPNQKDLIRLLDQYQNSNLLIVLPSGEMVPEHFHITEVGRVQKNFIDCGGTCRENVSCMLQVWTAHDVDHRLLSGKLSKIMKLSEKILGSDELPIEVEYGTQVASQYTVASIAAAGDIIVFILSGKQTDCLAPDKCGINNKGCC